MTTDDELERAAANCGEAYRKWVAGLGLAWRTWDDLVVADMGLAVSAPPNHATLKSPLTDDGVGDVVDRLRGFFDGSPGGGYELWSLWPTPDLSVHGFEPWSVPLMIRPASGDARPPPRELEIVEVDDDPAAEEASALLTVFGTPVASTAGKITVSMQSDTLRFWLGRVDGRPVSIAGASVSHGYVGIYAVATDPAFRGRGYGAALTWAAVTYRPDLPSTLQASPMGRSVYEGIGFTTPTEFHCWMGERRPAQFAITRRRRGRDTKMGVKREPGVR